MILGQFVMKNGILGFCFGGWILNITVVQVSDIASAVPILGG